MGPPFWLEDAKNCNYLGGLKAVAVRADVEFSCCNLSFGWVGCLWVLGVRAVSLQSGGWMGNRDRTSLCCKMLKTSENYRALWDGTAGSACGCSNLLPAAGSRKPLALAGGLSCLFGQLRQVKASVLADVLRSAAEVPGLS